MSPQTPRRRDPRGPYTPYRTDTLVVEHDGPVTVVTINRPERRNAVDSVCADQLREAFVAFDRDDEPLGGRPDRRRGDLLRRRRPQGGGRG